MKFKNGFENKYAISPNGESRPDKITKQ